MFRLNQQKKVLCQKEDYEQDDVIRIL